MRYYCEKTETALSELSTTSEGLSSEEAVRRLEANGKNRLADAPGKSLIRRFLEQLADPMIIILLVAALISGILAVVENESFADVIIILAVVIVNAVLGVYQENKAEKAFEALRRCRRQPLKSCATARSALSAARSLWWATWCCWKPATLSPRTDASFKAPA